MGEGVQTDRVLPEGLLGRLENLEREADDHGVLFLRGWILGNGSRVKAVILKRKNGYVIPVPYGLPRPDIAGAFPQDASAAKSGFAGQIVIGRPSSGPRDRLSTEQIEIYAEVENGKQ